MGKKDLQLIHRLWQDKVDYILHAVDEKEQLTVQMVFLRRNIYQFFHFDIRGVKEVMTTQLDEPPWEQRNRLGIDTQIKEVDKDRKRTKFDEMVKQEKMEHSKGIGR